MLDIHAFLKKLALSRPIFHSEADFQHAFAWQLHQEDPEMQIRLEYPHTIGEKRIYLDIWGESPETFIAVELKYKTKKLEVPYKNEHFLLKNHGAHDLGCYDFLKDVERLETVLEHSNKSVLRYAILLTNDESYLAESKKDTIDKAFRLYEQRELFGKLDWDVKAGAGTIKNRKRSITIRGKYSVTWNDYSTSADLGRFQYLAIQCL